MDPRVWHEGRDRVAPAGTEHTALQAGGCTVQTLRTGQGYLGDAALAATRTPAGHPEGYLEAFATLYRRFVADIRRVQAGQAPQRDYPGAAEGLRGLQLIAAAVRSSQRGAVWETLP